MTKEMAQPTLGAEEAFTELKKQLNAAISNGFRTLLEQKHLYQKLVIDAQKILDGIRARVFFLNQSMFEAKCNQLGRHITLTTLEDLSASINNNQAPSLFLVPDNIKLYCRRCGRSEAFRPVWFADLSAAVRSKSQLGVSLALQSDLQWFTFVYQCQSCRTVPEAILIRKENWQFSIHGRSPMEEVDVPAFIPKPERKWFRDAVIALHGGKVLAAVFYLRVFIEQFARRMTGLTGKVTGDEILDAYAGTIPIEHRNHMPSLKEWYDKLSEAVHAAREDAELFDAARNAVETHFDIRRVFKIKETEPQPNQSSSSPAKPNANAAP